MSPNVLLLIQQNSFAAGMYNQDRNITVFEIIFFIVVLSMLQRFAVMLMKVYM